MKYGDDFQKDLLEQYKLYVEMMDRTSSRRGQTNNFYISFLSGILALLSLLIDKNLLAVQQNILVVFLAFLGLFLCLIWNVNINSYKQLNFLKFRAIEEMEQ